MPKINFSQPGVVNEALRIVAVDPPGPTGSHHAYHISPASGRASAACFIQFQNGPIQEEGINGITNEALLAVVAHRLEAWQAGKFACEKNQAALDLTRAAMGAMASRTKERIARQVEGTHQV